MVIIVHMFLICANIMFAVGGISSLCVIGWWPTWRELWSDPHPPPLHLDKKQYFLRRTSLRIAKANDKWLSIRRYIEVSQTQTQEWSTRNAIWSFFGPLACGKNWSILNLVQHQADSIYDTFFGEIHPFDYPICNHSGHFFTPGTRFWTKSFKSWVLFTP